MDLDIDLRLIFAILNGRVSDAINRKLQENFLSAGIDLTPSQWTVMLYLAECGGVSQQTLCTATCKDKPAMTRNLAVLERQGFIHRHRRDDDQRTNEVYLTTEGKLMKQRAQIVAEKTMRQALRGLELDQITVSQEVLRRVFSNMTEE